MQLLKNQVVIESKQTEGWLEVDLKDQHMLMSEPFFISFQWINIDDPVPMVGADISKTKESYVRYNALGTWVNFAEWDIKVRGRY